MAQHGSTQQASIPETASACADNSISAVAVAAQAGDARSQADLVLLHPYAAACLLWSKPRNLPCATAHCKACLLHLQACYACCAC